MEAEPDQRPQLLYLPDEVISLIFSHLIASDTSGLFYRPRHAFALAITNTRFLRIFGTHLTRIVPDVKNEYIPTHNPCHVLSVIRIAGNSLRELHLPRKPAFPVRDVSIMQELAKLCPLLHTLSFHDGPSLSCMSVSGVRDVFSLLPLRSLSVTNPSLNTIKLLPATLQQLSLNNINVSDPCFATFLPIPSKKLHLDVRCGDVSYGSIFQDMVLGVLQKRCSKVEEFSLQLRNCRFGVRKSVEQLVALLKERPHNTDSKCRRMVLSGIDTMCFLKHAHPEAHVEITAGSHTVVDYGDGIYCKTIPLKDQYLTQDLSRLTHVCIESRVNPTWLRLLSDVRLKRLRVEDIEGL